MRRVKGCQEPRPSPGQGRGCLRRESAPTLGWSSSLFTVDTFPAQVCIGTHLCNC